MKFVDEETIVNKLDTDSRHKIQYGGIQAWVPGWDMHEKVLSTKITAWKIYYFNFYFKIISAGFTQMLLTWIAK